MGLLDIFKQKDSVPEKVETCEKTDSGANMVKEIREEILQKTAIPYMKLQLTDTKPSLFDSKVGGIGYVPRDAKIPEDSEGVQLRLLAQIDCAEITLEDFPHQGLLQFWIYDDDLSGADFDHPTVQNGFRILYHESVDPTVTEAEVLEKTLPFPEDESFFPVEKEVALKLKKSMESLSFSDYRFDKKFAEKFNQLSPEEPIEEPYDLDINMWDIEEPICKQFLENSGWGHKIGGFPAFTQSDPRDCMENADRFDTLLLQIDSGTIDDSHEIMWGDSGICNFFIHSEALRNCDFSEVLYNWDCY